ncbi:hypothetical protein [Prosthecobacter sp.]|uniref:hypothetical protein n=1 Tax=Prosthecobacter sp. TaxID=1965333 RepID=UPI002ABCD6BC|nr:hypothetical protein [Prosthecobacter sp.]MDZ4401502.1 hypothetical protein [Prosthecobacter sp.]
MNSSIHPIVVLAVLGIVASLILMVTVFHVRRAGLKVLLVLIAVLTLAPAGLVVLTMYPEWVDARFRSYKAFYDGIQLGMTRDEVLTVQAKLYPDSGPRQKPRIIVDEVESLTFFMHPEVSDSSVNCEGILLHLKEGKVVSKVYSPD